MKDIDRILNIDLPARQSAFLWGPRKTGKSTYLKKKFPDSLVFNFFKTDLYIEFSKNPSLLREQLLARSESALKHPIVLDEAQKVPQILDEVHWLIENKGLRFILCGSSARKLKRGQVNLLGGKKWNSKFFVLLNIRIKKILTSGNKVCYVSIKCNIIIA